MNNGSTGYMSPESRTEYMNSLNTIGLDSNTLWGRLVGQSDLYRSLAIRFNATLKDNELVALCGPSGSGRRTLIDSCLLSHTGMSETVRVDPVDELHWLPPHAFS